MGNFDRGGGRRSFGGGGRGRSFGGGRGGFRNGRRDGGDRGDRGPREMFKVVCSNCGKDCEVPFKPTSDKPVYCSDCFEKMGGGERRERRPSFRGPRQDNRIDEANAKLDKILQLLEANSL